MRVFGLDFTSAPRAAEPITCAKCQFDGQTLTVGYVKEIRSFQEFDEFLNQVGPWVAGMDFPFGQPRKLIEALGWPKSWEGYVSLVSELSPEDFETTLAEFRSAQPSGQRHLYRVTDRKARSCSPMMLYGVPVGKMFHRGAPRLLRSGANILPCRPNDSDRIILEAYPKLVAVKCIGSRKYKAENVRGQTVEKADARRDLITALRTPNLRRWYDLDVDVPVEMASKLVEDGTGDKLDALLCAIQAAWSYSLRNHNFGIPEDCDSAEGWIVDPDMLVSDASERM